MYNILKRMINQDNYDSIEDIRNKIDVFYAVTPARLNTEQYKALNDILNSKQDNILVAQV